MITALFTSRALLSMGMIGFLFFTCVHKDTRAQWKAFIKSPLSWSLLLLFLIPLLTFFWSEDKTSWMRWARIKLPLLLLPYGFAGAWKLQGWQWKTVALVFLFAILAGCSWSLVQYASAWQSIHANYLRSHILITPLDNDHVRFSLVVCIGVILSILLIEKEQKKWMRLLLTVTAALFCIYLHILSARTGLLCLYIFLFIYLLHRFFYRQKKAASLVTVVLLFGLPVLAWYFLPTFQNRIRYFLYDFSHVRARTYLPGSNDGNRVLSLQAGWGILKQHPFGVGSGDVVAETYQWYDRNMPQVQQSDRIYPSSEWLLYGAAAGWAGVLLFTLAMVLPFFENLEWGKVFWNSLLLASALSFLFDIGLETQFGVFIHAFILLWWKKWMGKEAVG